MKHSLLRKKSEIVKIFSHKDPDKVQKTLSVFSFGKYGLSDITPNFNVTDLNDGYYSTEIITPNIDTYLLILFCGSPIVLRVGHPDLQFFMWSATGDIETYKHYNENGGLVSEGKLKLLNYGFSYYTPVEETLGYVEVNGRPSILNVPYSVSYAGIGINVDWRRTIIRQEFGVKTSKFEFELNTINNTFEIKTTKKSFNMDTIYNEFDRKTIKQKFVVLCNN